MLGFVASTTSSIPSLLDAMEQLADAEIGRARRRRAGRASRRARGRARGTRASARARRRRRAARRRRRSCGRGAGRVQTAQSSSSVRLPQSRQKRTRSFTSVIALRARGPRRSRRERRWNVSRCAVRVPIPGSRVSWATRLSTAGLSMRLRLLIRSRTCPPRTGPPRPPVRAGARRSRRRRGRQARAARPSVR